MCFVGLSSYRLCLILRIIFGLMCAVTCVLCSVFKLYSLSNVFCFDYSQAMGLDYSYTQPSESEDYGLGGSADSGNSSTEMYIQLDQAQIKPHAISTLRSLKWSLASPKSATVVASHL